MSINMQLRWPIGLVESITKAQLKQMMDRWGYEGVGVVNDPLVPEVEFLKRS